MCKCQKLHVNENVSVWQDIDRIMLLHGARVMESVKPILDSETRTEDVKEQVNTTMKVRVLEFKVQRNLWHALISLAVLKSWERRVW